MTIEKIAELIRVIPINKDSTNVIFISKSAITQEEASRLAKYMKKEYSADFGAICMVNGNPNDVVKLVDAKDVEAVDESA